MEFNPINNSDYKFGDNRFYTYDSECGQYRVTNANRRRGVQDSECLVSHPYSVRRLEEMYAGNFFVEFKRSDGQSGSIIRYATPEEAFTVCEEDEYKKFLRKI